MKLSTKCRYGSRAIMEIARHFEGAPLKRKDIARAQSISASYLENILISLKNAGLIDTRRGVNGGFIMSREPSSISMFEVVTALEGSLAPVECLENPSLCDKVDNCSTRIVWKKMQDAKEGVLRSISVQDLVEMENSDATIDYVI